MNSGFLRFTTTQIAVCPSAKNSGRIYERTREKLDITKLLRGRLVLKKKDSWFLGRIVKRIKNKKERIKKPREYPEKQYDVALSPHIGKNRKLLEQAFINCHDVVFYSFKSGGDGIECFVAYIKSISSAREVSESVIGPLKDPGFKARAIKSLRTISERLPVKSGDIITVPDISGIIENVVNGYCVILVDGFRHALACNTFEDKSRKVDIASSELNIKGPQHAFVENLGTNMSLIRSIIRSPALKTEIIKVGRLSGTKVVIAYIEGIADRGVVKEVKKRIAAIDIDIITDSSVVESLSEDQPLSPFPQMRQTEKPNACCEELAQGKVAVLVDGSPFVLIIPAVFFDFLLTAEENYSGFYFIIFLRLIRYFIFLITLLGPSVYVALTSYHQEMIPTPLLIAIAQSRAETPLPAVLEALLMELIFEIIREASIRLPKVVGPSVTIVGGLVIGQGAVEAGIVSQTMVIVVAITGISAFALPEYNQEIVVRLLRFPMMILAAALGMFGIIMGIIILVIHLTSLRSFGVPYFSPVAPLSLQDWKRMIIKYPLWAERERTTYLKHDNRYKFKRGAKPKPPGKEEGNGGRSI